MDFGKLQNIESVDFRLPPDSVFNQNLWSSLEQNEEEMTVYVGCTGFGMPEWVGNYYPIGAKPKDFLKEYGLQFNTIEHNSTHYRIPDVATVQKWHEVTTPDFRFCPKLPQSISHSRFLGVGSGLVEQFCDTISLLHHKLGTCFMQLPPHFSVDKLYILKHFLEQFPTQIPLAIEVRHESFFENNLNFKSLYDLLSEHSIGTVITDVSGRRDVLHQGLSTDFATIRFVGNNLHHTDYQRIDTWVERLLEWKTKGIKSIYFFVHEPDNIKAPELATYFVTKLLAKNIKTRGPKSYQNPSVQMQLF